MIVKTLLKKLLKIWHVTWISSVLSDNDPDHFFKTGPTWKINGQIFMKLNHKQISFK